MKSFHRAVMLKEVIWWLNIREGGVYLDCTVGAGGHSRAILDEMRGKVRIIGIDRDEEALKIASQELKEYRKQTTLIKANFKELPQILKEENVGLVNGIIYDLGLSSMQLDSQTRGFSFRWTAPLDMRMDSSQALTAAHLVGELSQKELEDIFFELGEERWARRIAKFIVEERRQNPIKTTSNLLEVMRRAVPAKFRRGRRTHFATRVFQALRIKVNEELENLRVSLSYSFDLLQKEGRVCVISYHSLEDRIVKQKFNEAKEEKLNILTKKVIRPSKKEVRINPRARSARLRVAERI
ncbi:16S rRNA (cytosine(1402)-N(4))-methyltransferase RsmH [Candidatus Aerophobetes bacterium]|uniref:Ribosomal RNA small subunit methyltransferase H n=1 Tax=Aerophobetes bacterium TaxID=2030807 RepID=A0A523Y1H0_UNCAE|nr:MAG: 16S rRNA (cytosine(1402)-N(4))-methyltransferase RsmH [Candidatus Aerophobetes bacterium]